MLGLPNFSGDFMSTIFSQDKEFSTRHIGPNDSQIQEMLNELGFDSLEELENKVIPRNIRSLQAFKFRDGISEAQLLNRLQGIMSKNKIFKSYIGLGFHDTHVPTVIQRNVLENPVWYTAYTPYQAEIAQGRMESILNFQTMIKDLTGMEIANASLLDEGTAAAEAMAMAHSLAKTKSKTFIVSPSHHPHVIEVLKTRSEPLGFKMLLQEPSQFDWSEPVFAVFVSYPDTHGLIHDWKKLAEQAHFHGAFVCVDTDLMSLTLLQPPGEWGADIVYGNSQRFGVPLGFGGPHAAYFATKDSSKRLLPGRLVGVSIDSQGGRALRLTLQTREQHIRREKATSNICTAQVLLANMAAMYAVYHGPDGLKKIATRIHAQAALLKKALIQDGVKVTEGAFFDTLEIEVNSQSVALRAEARSINVRILNENKITVSLNETTDFADLADLFTVITGKTAPIFEASHPPLFEGWNALVRTSQFMTHPTFNSHHSETQLLRYIHSLQNKDISLAHSMIPLGSCTMKLNATTELVPVSWPTVNRLHPFAPISQAQGYLELIRDLEAKLCEITGFAGVSLQPNAGSQGEFAGLLTIREYHKARNQGHRDICLIPSSAHGTNPASAAMAGMQIVVVHCDSQGNVDVADLKKKASENKDKLSCLMITYPSTHGVFEESIAEICSVVHEHGGQVYMDGANFNAMVGVCRPGEFGVDVSHMNLHKTFSIPHGGGGPGVGPIGVAAHLKPFLPQHSMAPEVGPATGISATTSAPWGSASILPISWSYITLMGLDELRKATLVAILNANYVALKLGKHFPILYKGKEGLVAHECILDLREIKKTSGIDVTDVAKRLMDYGFHAPTMSWPVPGTLMVEPTESEAKPELDRFIEAMLSIRNEIDAVEKKKISAEDNQLVNAPHTFRMVMSDEWKHPYSRTQAATPLPWVAANKIWPAVARVDNAYGDKNIMCSCPPLEDYQ